MSSKYYGRGFDHSQYQQKYTYPSQWRPSPNPSPRLDDSFSHLHTPPQSSPRLGYFPQRPHTPRTFRKASIEPLILDYGENNNHNPYARPENSFQNSFLYNWGLCILSVIISILSMGAITALLILVDGNPIPKLPLNITVNTLVSFLSTIAKASMLVPVAESISQLKWLWFRQPRTLQDMQIFDDASRGPLGAVRLVWKTRAVRLAAVGAAITVLSLVMDPASQQIVGFPEWSVRVGGATVGRAQAYDAGLLLESLDGGLLTGTEFAMKAAIYDGIFKPSGAHDLEPVCPTGNCTFPLFDSLAVCSKCVDVSKDVINNTPEANPTRLVGDHEISYTMPGGATIKFVARFAESMLQMGPAFISTAGVPPGLSKDILGLQDPLFTLAVLQFPNAMLKIADGNYYSSLPIANECALYFCVNTYNVSVLNSKPNTTVVSSWTSETGTPTVGGKSKTGNSMIGTKDAILERPPDGVDGNHTYWIPAGTLANLKAWLNSTLQGSMNTSTSLVDTSHGPVWADDEIQTLNVTTDWSYLMGALATCMTTYIRSSGFKDSVGVAEGVAFKNETYVQVQWVWLCLPMALVSMSILFLVATMIVNHRKRAMAWKSSSLALLFHGLEGVGSRGAGEGMGDMDELAKKTRVILTRGDNGEYKLINTG